MKKYTSALVVCLVLSSLAMARPAPSFRAELLNGDRVSLTQYLKPQRILFLSFWATWCVPCLEELKLVTDRLKQNPNLALDVLTVNVDSSETSSDIKPTLKQNNYQFPVIADPKHEIFSKYQQEKALPYSVLIDESGNIVETFSGFHEEMFAKVEGALKKKEVAASGAKSETK